jgi:hypothetical protein
MMSLLESNLAVRAFAKAHGRFPTSLSEVVDAGLVDAATIVDPRAEKTSLYDVNNGVARLRSR